MSRRSVMTVLVAAMAGVFLGGPVRAASEAFIGLTDIGQASWGRDLAVREILEGTLGFEPVQIAVDATPAELPARVRAFLERKGAPGDRRFVWISGPNSDKEAGSPCPSAGMAQVVPATAALIVAPACFADLIALPPGSHHIALRDADARARFPDGRAETRPVVLVALPSDTPAAIRQADAIVLDALRAAEGGTVTPALLLQRLRYELRADGSDYTPTLDASSGAAVSSRRFLTPPRPDKGSSWRPLGPDDFAGRLAWPHGDRIDLFAVADDQKPPVLQLAGRQPVTVLRTSADGAMAFVRAPGALFGWVKSDALD